MPADRESNPSLSLTCYDDTTLFQRACVCVRTSRNRTPYIVFVTTTHSCSHLRHQTTYYFGKFIRKSCSIVILKVVENWHRNNIFKEDDELFKSSYFIMDLRHSFPCIGDRHCG
ncbi:uncharacterized protein LOC115033038 [Acyrthosiphon pisum]|uniref:Uncharacterized protein n=1 Tax=Acyrthosiphon pisum TaxID=7029 RepID=A0A8R2NLW2_ACYPI|nr:uncharacterized protein LOC115033038 [Acyrthosiphon pisum]